MPSQESQTPEDEQHSRESTVHGNQGVHKGSIETNLGDLTPEQLRVYRRNRAEYDAQRKAMEGWARGGFMAGDVPSEERFDSSHGRESAEAYSEAEAEVIARYSRETDD
jgi:hypothetical protein